MSKETLQQSIQQIEKEMQNANNEVKAVNAAAEYITVATEKGEEKLDNKEIAEMLNEEYKTNLNEQDLEKIEKVVEAEKSGDIENVGWDKENNDVDMNKINDIYENNKDIFEKEANNNMQTENSMQQENENKIEKNETSEEKEGFLDKAKEAISEKFEELQQAAQNVDLYENLRESDNVFDKAQAEAFDKIDAFTQELHNKNNETTQDKNEEKMVEIPLKNNDQEINNEGISKETQEKLEQKAEQAEKLQEQNQENQTEKSEKSEKEVELEASH